MSHRPEQRDISIFKLLSTSLVVFFLFVLALSLLLLLFFVSIMVFLVIPWVLLFLLPLALLSCFFSLVVLFLLSCTGEVDSSIIKFQIYLNISLLFHSHDVLVRTHAYFTAVTPSMMNVCFIDSFPIVCGTVKQKLTHD